MASTKRREAISPRERAAGASRALEWLWAYFQDQPRPHIFDCGPTSPVSINVLLKRKAKLFLADLITPALRESERFWKRDRKTAVFRTDDFLAQLPPIPGESLSLVLGWQVFDLLPREALPPLVERLAALLQPGGVLFFLLREPYLAAGAETDWWLEDLQTLGSTGKAHEPFPYPALTNREVERLLGSNNVKTFLTRHGRREILALK